MIIIWFLLTQISLCSIKHVHVNRKVDLQDALISAQHEALDSVIEVESCIEGNTSFHR